MPRAYDCFVGDGAESTQTALFEAPAAPGRPIGKQLTLLEGDGTRAVFLRSAAIHVYEADDKEAEAACIATLSRAGLASDVDIASAFGVHRNTVGRLARRFESQGLAAVVPAKRGPKGPSKVTPEVLAIIDAHADLPRKELRQRIEKQTGVCLSLPYVSELAIVRRPTQLSLDGVTAHAAATPEERNIVGDDSNGAAANDLEERTNDIVESSVSVVDDTEDTEPGPELPLDVSGRYMGLALYYPALAATGLLDVARSLYRLPNSVRFGVRTTVATLFFMTVLAKTTLEAAKHLRRAEFGAVVGSGVAPCVKTLRRKLAMLVDQHKAGDLGTHLTRRWIDGGLVATAYLYIDGHMKVYSGKKKLQEVWNSQRRMPLPGIHTYYVGDGQGRPLLFVAEELSTNLAKAIPRIVEAIREVSGDRSFAIVFDRGGYDGQLFSWLRDQNIDFITYQRGDVELEVGAFTRRQTRFEGRRRRFFLAEDTVKVKRTGPWRRVVVRAKKGHQTPILTSLGPQVPAARIAALMFARWRQENFFKYMGEHRGLDDITSYATEQAGTDIMVMNPSRKALDGRIAEATKCLAALKASLGSALLDEPRAGRSAHGLKTAQGGAVKEVRDLEAQIAALKSERTGVARQIPISESAVRRDVTLREAKAIVDRIKISAYNAEEWLLDRLVAHYPNEHDVRDLLRSFTELSGRMTTTTRGVVVRIDPPDTPMHRRALIGLVADLNAIGAMFPGTDVPVTYEVAVHHADLAA